MDADVVQWMLWLLMLFSFFPKGMPLAIFLDINGVNTPPTFSFSADL